LIKLASSHSRRKIRLKVRGSNVREEVKPLPDRERVQKRPKKKG
jgi:hypothetical protein